MPPRPPPSPLPSLVLFIAEFLNINCKFYSTFIEPLFCDFFLIIPRNVNVISYIPLSFHNKT